MLVSLPLDPTSGLKPHVPDTSAVASQVVEAFKAVEMVDEGYGRRLREPQIDGDTSAALLVGLKPAPIRNAPAVGAEMKAEVRATDVGLSGADTLMPSLS